jgi:integrase
MTFSESIARYVVHKNGSGVMFDSGKRYLVSLSRRIGDKDLSMVRVDDVMAFLNDSKGQNSTWRMKYNVLIRFFEFWASRGEMSYLLFPPPKPGVRRSFAPHIYSRDELRALFRALDHGRETHILVHRVTMRTLMLFLYGTGALLGEAISLQLEDVDLENRKISIENRISTRSRQIPICDDLSDILRRFLKWRLKNKFVNSHFFVNRRDEPLRISPVEKKFCRLRKSANIWRELSASCQPRLQDLKCTFAVHRITSWIRSGADLNRMLPALAVTCSRKSLPIAAGVLS